MFHLFTEMNYQVANDAMSPWQYKYGYVNTDIKEVFLYKCAIFSNASSKIVRWIMLSHWHLSSQVPDIF